MTFPSLKSDSIIILEELKKRYNNNEVSALIGAGFSKNAYSLFPSWTELLYDMVSELYKDEIEREFEIKTLRPIKIDYLTFKNDKIKQIITREGYLDIVSNYVKKKGYREALENYIEEKIPYITDKLELFFGNGINPQNCIKNEDLSVHAKLLEGNWDNIYTTNYDELLEITSNRNSKNWKLITKSNELSFSKQKPSIIKLHGNRHNPTLKNDKTFEFDGNCHQRYVITKEDYANYPQEHEAFTQLMRISLLQGTFCLIGFSGDDPNFIAWINWVRDILEIHNNTQYESNEYDWKIILIAMDSKNPTPDKQLFYDNHKIKYIPLLNEQILNIIKAEKGEKKDKKILLLKFFSYLYEYDYSSYNENPKQKYQDLWSKAYTSNKQINNNKLDISISINNNFVNDLIALKPSNRIVKYTCSQERLLKDLYNQNTYNEQEISLILLALQDTYFLPNYFPNLSDKMEKQVVNEQQRTIFKSFVERSNTLNNINDNKTHKADQLDYDRILYSAFRLDFSTLKKQLSLWNVAGTDIPKKALFLSLFDTEQAKTLLLNYIDTEIEMKERYYATQLLNLINDKDHSQYSTSKYENQNIDGIWELKKYFFGDSFRDKQSITPYGDNQGQTIHFGNNNEKYEFAFRALQFLIEAPLFISQRGFSYIIGSDKWYYVFKELFEFYPYPILFYSLQCTDEKICKRIGQDFAYSDRLLEQLPNILDCLLNAYNNSYTPSYWKNKILIIAQELFVTVVSSKWENKFIEIWNTEVIPNYKTIDYHIQISKFVFAALPYIKSKQIATKIIQDCLKNEKLNIDITIASLYFLRIVKRKNFLNEELQKEINNFINNIKSDNEFAIAGNIYNILSPDNIKTLSIKIEKIINDKGLSMISIKAISYFSHKTKTNELLVRNVIINSKDLWGNGLNNNSASVPNFIELSSLRNNIKWNKKELITIYNKLKESFDKVIDSSFYKKRDNFSFINYNGLFFEMFKFLSGYQKILSKEHDYSEIKDKLIKELQSIRNFVNVEEALLSDDTEKIRLGIEQLDFDIISNGIEQRESDLHLILNKILFKKPEGLFNCFQYIAYLISEYRSNIVKMSSILNVLDKIIKEYNKETLQLLDLDVAKVSGSLIEIAHFLNKNNYKSEGITYWINMKKIKRFNCIQ